MMKALTSAKCQTDEDLCLLFGLLRCVVLELESEVSTRILAFSPFLLLTPPRRNFKDSIRDVKVQVGHVGEVS